RPGLRVRRGQGPAVELEPDGHQPRGPSGAVGPGAAEPGPPDPAVGLLGEQADPHRDVDRVVGDRVDGGLAHGGEAGGAEVAVGRRCGREVGVGGSGERAQRARPGRRVLARRGTSEWASGDWGRPALLGVETPGLVGLHPCRNRTRARRTTLSRYVWGYSSAP